MKAWTLGARLSLLALVAILPAPTPAVDVPGWERDPIPGAPKGTESALLQVYEDVLSPDLLQALRDEAPHLAEFAKTFGNLKNSKYTTFWKPTGKGAPAARTASEHAVDVMFDILFGKGVGSAGDAEGVGNGDEEHRRRMRAKVVGGKYWYQYRGPGDGVGFHYDKDEGMASDQMIMRFPMYSTVTYIEPKGAPTIILNQTIIKNGNVEVPGIPNEGWFVYPKVNKMMVQRGDLNHGANDYISAKPLMPGDHRVTFVVSWEDVKPLEPNCHYIRDDEMPSTVKVPSIRPPSWHLGKSIRRVETSKVEPRHGGSEARWFELPLGRDGSRLHALLPSPQNRQAVPDPSGSYLISWGRRQVFGQVYELDLHSQSQRRMLFNGGKPAVIMIVSGHAGDRSNERVAALRAAKAWINRFGVESANFFLGYKGAHANVLKEFGLRKKDVPIAMVHHIHRSGNPMYVMNRRTNKHAEWTSRRILRFLSKVQKGKVKKISNKGLQYRRFEEL